MNKESIKGKIWVLTGSNHHLIEDIDTDQIFHNAHLHITELERMGPFALGNLEGWKDFPDKVRPGDMILAGRNFGAGSSRQQAVDCFRALGVGLIMAPSFGAIYFRNAVNSGFPVVRCLRLAELVEAEFFQTGDEIRINIRTGEGFHLGRREAFGIEAMSDVEYAIWEAGGLFAFSHNMNLPGSI